jgi:4-phytase/acid phosphatase
MQRTPYLAARQGSALVQRILTTMRRSINGRADVSQPAGAKLTLLVGHDTNLANIGGMLGIHWSLPSYLPDQTPPAGALHFELLRSRQTGIHGVRVRFISQTPEQMRWTAPLDRAHPPEQTIASIEGCATSAGGTCPWTAFEALARKAIDHACAGKE